MKFVKIAGVTTIVVIALAVLGVTLAFAQKPTPTDPPWWNSMRNMMRANGGRGMMGGSTFNNGGCSNAQPDDPERRDGRYARVDAPERWRRYRKWRARYRLGRCGRTVRPDLR